MPCFNANASALVYLRSHMKTTNWIFHAQCKAGEQNAPLPRLLTFHSSILLIGLQEDHTVHMVRGLPASSANTAGSANLGGSNTTSGASRATFQSNEGGLFRGTNLGASLLPGLRVNGLGGSGVPGMLGTEAEFEQVQQQLTQNPNMMREIMNMPVMQSLMNNPDLMRTLIMSNPQMRDIMDRNPELAHILNDPGTLLQTLEAARNPELMREMMRNTDRAMSNIESSPEGFNMLRRMYETVQEPLMNATTMAGDAENNSGSNLFASLLGNQGGPQDRDRSINPSTTGSAAPNTEPLPNPWGGAGGKNFILLSFTPGFFCFNWQSFQNFCCSDLK